MNLQLQRQRCSRLERFSKNEEDFFLFSIMHQATRGVEKISNSGVVSPVCRIGPRNQSYDRELQHQRWKKREA
jgi:hypothetical protein